MAAEGCPAVPVRIINPVFFFIVVLMQCIAVMVHGQPQEGFISIDCGIADGAGYRDRSSGIVYKPDTDYIDAGVSKNILSNLYNLYIQYQTLRSFPEGIRNCYRLRPVRPNEKYLVRAAFYYGNYDGKNAIPIFDLHIGVNLWRTVDSLSAGVDTFIEEIITVAPSDSLSVCLVNTGRGTPFISSLELRPLSDSMYLFVNQSQSLVLIQHRWNCGANSQMRFPGDPYDRIWFNFSSGFPTLDAKAEVKRRAGDEFEVPTSVLSTAVRTYNTSYYITSHITAVNARAGDRIYVILHFAEIERLMPNESRKMDIYEGEYRSGRLLYGNYSPPYLLADAMVASGTLHGEDGATYNLSIDASASSTRPPIINAREIYLVRPMDVLPTHRGDEEAMEDIKRFYKVTRNWMGDPCAPENFRWDRVNCSYEASSPPRVIHLNLTSSGLSGGIPASLANLTALTTLDMSNNSLTGAIPDFLAELPSLKLLILAGNQLTGTIPSRLCEKNQTAALSISIEGNPAGRCSQTTKKKKTFILVAIIASASIGLLILLVISIIVWKIRRRKSSTTVSDGLPRMQQKEELELNTAKATHSIFTFTEIKEITNNFEKPIGRGGFGTVYLGYVNDGTQVAVKVLSPLSSQGPKEFQAEALLLTRVHHKNLVSLLGYCRDEHNLALVYEYMDQGTLQDHLSGNTGNLYVLGWEQRVKIALQAAQGLDYLHNGCRPPIIHRDVKSSNILLNHDFIAKLADFGLSRAFHDDTQTPMSTAVAGTPGYLDPEYYQTYRLNEKSDVYSFGIVLLEIVTGRPVFSRWPERTHITQWVQSRLESGGINIVVDTRLCGDYDINSAHKMLEIAMACTSASSMRRLTMSSVVIKLKECLEIEVTGESITDDSGVPSGSSPP